MKMICMQIGAVSNYTRTRISRVRVDTISRNGIRDGIQRSFLGRKKYPSSVAISQRYPPVIRCRESKVLSTLFATKVKLTLSVSNSPPNRGPWNPETSPSPCGKGDEAMSACEPYPSLQVLWRGIPAESPSPEKGTGDVSATARNIVPANFYVLPSPLDASDHFAL